MRISAGFVLCRPRIDQEFQDQLGERWQRRGLWEKAENRGLKNV